MQIYARAGRVLLVAKTEASSALVPFRILSAVTRRWLFTQRAWRRNIAARWKNISRDIEAQRLADGAVQQATGESN